MCTAYPHIKSVVSPVSIACNNCSWFGTNRRRALHPHSRSVVCLADSKSAKRPKEYIGLDGRRKSTLEEAFTPDTDLAVGDPSAHGRPPPWAIGWQTNEGSIEWNDDIKLRLLKVLRCFESVASKILSYQSLMQASTVGHVAHNS